MARSEDSLPMGRHHLFIYDEDWEFLVANYGPESASNIGVSTAIRKIIHAKVLGLKAQATAAAEHRLAGKERKA